MSNGTACCEALVHSHRPLRSCVADGTRMRQTFRTPRELQVRPTRPPVSSPRVAANRREAEKGDRYWPELSTLANLSSRFSRGTRTPEKRIEPLSTPFRPTCSIPLPAGRAGELCRAAGMLFRTQASDSRVDSHCYSTQQGKRWQAWKGAGVRADLVATIPDLHARHALS